MTKLNDCLQKASQDLAARMGLTVILSPTSECPSHCAWARIWCLRPVWGRRRRRVNS
jgi:hypothetical protein